MAFFMLWLIIMPRPLFADAQYFILEPTILPNHAFVPVTFAHLKSGRPPISFSVTYRIFPVILFTLHMIYHSLPYCIILSSTISFSLPWLFHKTFASITVSHRIFYRHLPIFLTTRPTSMLRFWPSYFRGNLFLKVVVYSKPVLKFVTWCMSKYPLLSVAQILQNLLNLSFYSLNYATVHGINSNCTHMIEMYYKWHTIRNNN